MFHQVGILGLGLIGTSLGLAIKRTPGAPRVHGHDVNGEALRRASKAGAIDKACTSPAELCKGSDAVVLATPVGSILELLPEIAPHLASDTLVTDTGGTKVRIVSAAHKALADPSRFVGGHPMAGRLTAGVAEPSADLYRGALYCLTVSPSTAPWAIDAAVQLVESLGAEPFFIDADEHDALLAGISHLPYLASVALVNAVTSQQSWAEMASLAAGGFRTVSSLVDADERMWAQVAETNRENIALQLDRLIESLARLRGLVRSADPNLLTDLRRARSYYRAWRYGAEPRLEGGPIPEASPPLSRGTRWLGPFRRT